MTPLLKALAIAVPTKGFYRVMRFFDRVLYRRFWIVPLMVGPNEEVLLRLADMVVAGVLHTTIEGAYALDGFPEALCHLGEGRAIGKLVIETG